MIFPALTSRQSVRTDICIVCASSAAVISAAARVRSWLPVTSADRAALFIIYPFMLAPTSGLQIQFPDVWIRGPVRNCRSGRSLWICGRVPLRGTGSRTYGKAVDNSFRVAHRFPTLLPSRPQAPQSNCWFWIFIFLSHFMVSSSPSSGTNAVRTRTPKYQSPPR